MHVWHRVDRSHSVAYNSDRSAAKRLRTASALDTETANCIMQFIVDALPVEDTTLMKQYTVDELVEDIQTECACALGLAVDCDTIKDHIARLAHCEIESSWHA